MKAHAPLQLLVGITRMIAIYFGLRGLDATAGAVMTYDMQRHYAPQIAATMPGTWSIYGAAICLYIGLMLAVWFAAPAICRLATRVSTDESQEASRTETCWNEVMIFLVGTLLVGWGIAHLVDVLGPIWMASVRNLPGPFRLVDAVQCFTNAALIGFGAILMNRFVSIHRWIIRRSKSQSALANDTVS